MDINKLKSLLVSLQLLLDGKKTYLTGIAAVCTGLVNHDYQLVLNGLGLVFLRNAVAKG